MFPLASTPDSPAFLIGARTLAVLFPRRNSLPNFICAGSNSARFARSSVVTAGRGNCASPGDGTPAKPGPQKSAATRSEEHTSELQSRVDLVCRLLLEKKKTIMATLAPIY